VNHVEAKEPDDPQDEEGRPGRKTRNPLRRAFWDPAPDETDT
jgi:hypothetical protein